MHASLLRFSESHVTGFVLHIQVYFSAGVKIPWGYSAAFPQLSPWGPLGAAPPCPLPPTTQAQ